MSMYQQYRQQVRERLHGTSYIKVVAFGISICESMLPNYYVFERMHGGENHQKIVEIIQEFWNYIENDNINKDIIPLRIAFLEKIVPNSEIFNSVFTWKAIYAIDALIDLLNYCLVNDIKNIVNIVEIALAGINQYISDTTLPIVEVYSKDQAKHINEWVSSAPLLIEELNKQQALLLDIGGSSLTNGDITRIRQFIKTFGIAPVARGLFVI